MFGTARCLQQVEADVRRRRKRLMRELRDQIHDLEAEEQ